MAMPRRSRSGDVILFKSDQVAETDLKIWAHELTHVMQYQRWGVDGFAERYVRDSAAVEQEAIDNANRFAAWRHAGDAVPDHRAALFSLVRPPPMQPIADCSVTAMRPPSRLTHQER